MVDRRKRPLILTIFLLIIMGCSKQPERTSTPLYTPIHPSATMVPTATVIPTPTHMPSPTVPAIPIYESAARIGRAVNLGNALEAPNEGEWGVTLKAEYFQLIKSAGFSAVRIPIRFSAHALAEAPYTIDEVFFQRVDWAVNNALDQGLVAIIDMHHYLEMFETPLEHKVRFLGLWQQIAERYKDVSPDMYFELLNEPHDKLTAEMWNVIAAEAVALIRQTNPKRPIILGPAGWGNVTQLTYLIPPKDENLIITFHYYEPHKFTHQGAEWEKGADAWLGLRWVGSTAERRVLRDNLKLAIYWAKEYNLPVFLGEFGVYNKADMESRILWTDAVARTAEELGIVWGYWEFCAGFGVYDPVAEEWNEPILRALIP